MTSCTLCNSAGPFHPKSHVIPQWMYEMLPMDDRRMRIASSLACEWEQRSPTGMYGSFVCKSCEDRFTGWDNYAAAVLREKPEATGQGWDFGKYDHDRLLRFFLSVLWRMHACEHRFFETVDLGSQTVSLTRFLLGNSDFLQQDFEVVPTYSTHLLSCGVMAPILIHVEGVPYWQIYLPRFQALIKIVSGPGAACLQPYVMANGKSLCMLEKNFDEFNEIQTFERVVAENLKRKNGKRHKF